MPRFSWNLAALWTKSASRKCCSRQECPKLRRQLFWPLIRWTMQRLHFCAPTRRSRSWPRLRSHCHRRPDMPGMKGTMAEYKEGKLHSGSKHGPKVKSRAQAIAIGLNEERKEGKNVPKKNETEMHGPERASSVAAPAAITAPTEANWHATG